MHQNAKIPSKRDEDGCYDLYACFEEKEIVIEPHEIKLIPTGIASVFDKKYRVAFRERGSNTKSKLIVMAGQIDSGYRGEWFVALYNTQDYAITIDKDSINYIKTEDELYIPYNKAICQFAIEEVPSIEIEEITYDELMNFKSDRMTGKLGSSNK